MGGGFDTERVLIAGLGNPGPKYDMTRHNWGFIIVDALARHANLSLDREKFHARIGSGDLSGQQVVLLKPQTFMNKSGLTLAEAAKFYQTPPAAWIIIHDDLDLQAGLVRVKVGGGHGGHNGLRSIIADTGQSAFIRLRIGIGRPPAPQQDPVDWVLGRFSPLEQATLPKVIENAIDAILMLISRGPAAAQNTINARPAPPNA